VVAGAGAKILGPIRIGDNCRVGANSVVIEDVPAGMTVVGIPGRIVVPAHERRVIGERIDLEHHRMPDPVGRAIAGLLERIERLEQQVAAASHVSEQRRQAFETGSPEELASLTAHRRGAKLH
jgi:serine O-acetyltransferase